MTCQAVPLQSQSMVSNHPDHDPPSRPDATPVLSHRPPPPTRTHHEQPPRSWSTAHAQCQRDTGSATSTTISPHNSESATLDPTLRPPVRDPQTAIHGAATEALDLRDEAMNVGGGVRHGSEDQNKDVNISTHSVLRTLLSELDRLDAETIGAGRGAHRSPCWRTTTLPLSHSLPYIFSCIGFGCYLAATLFTPETPAVFCGLKHFTHSSIGIEYYYPTPTKNGLVQKNSLHSAAQGESGWRFGWQWQKERDRRNCGKPSSYPSSLGWNQSAPFKHTYTLIHS
ncbi:unnamed protein product [Pleuronectes platessa]|uniref:Uncharacterized protein n=1 Tax=Pleuronectes platessa TaxID=8262 RepID=A0A9N7YLM5_PLEPL|nr:unnamed protein product [Pleuronectes platessa]